jgi:DNA-binding CsgD family transcriptional regulator
MLRLLLAALSLCIAAGTAAQPPSEAPKKPAAVKPAAKAPQPKPGVRPAWAELTAEQQQILAPLKPDWDTLEPERRQKWIAIAKRYPRMKVQEQERVQRRMQAWARLTPEQRRQARDTYKHLAKTPRQAPNKDLRQAWAEYQALSPRERDNLAPPASTDPRRQKH